MEEDIQSLVVFPGLGEVEEVLTVGLGEDQVVFVVSSVVPADIQQGVDFPLELQPEAVDEAHLVRTVDVVEGQSSALIVEKQSDPAGGTQHRQDHPA